jgi:hypothetical protein
MKTDNRTDSKDDIRPLGQNEIDAASGAGISYSAGCGCIDISIGGVGIWFGRNGAGWYAGDKAGRINW